MRKAIFTMLVGAISLMALSTSVRATMIAYSCTEPGDLAGAMIIRVDTETHGATESELRVFTVQGVAQVTDATMSL